MKVLFAINFKDLNDNDVLEGETPMLLSRILASNMAGQVEGVDVIKFFDWARAIYKGEAIDIDRVDAESLKNFIVGNKQLSVLVKGRLVACLDTSAE